jgi:hypothetical protein
MNSLWNTKLSASSLRNTITSTGSSFTDSFTDGVAKWAPRTSLPIRHFVFAALPDGALLDKNHRLLLQRVVSHTDPSRVAREAVVSCWQAQQGFRRAGCAADGGSGRRAAVRARAHRERAEAAFLRPAGPQRARRADGKRKAGAAPNQRSPAEGETGRVPQVAPGATLAGRG